MSRLILMTQAVTHLGGSPNFGGEVRDGDETLHRIYWLIKTGQTLRDNSKNHL
jgi:hypothetical protein